jgi:hypothetical protein
VSGAGEARQRAADFVAAHGEALARHRSAALLGASAQPALDALAQLDPALPGALARVVAVCDELGALRSVVARDALARLEAGQADDGAFARASLPLSERLRLTGDLGGILARSPYGRPESLASAGDFLARHFTPDRLQGFQWGNVAAYARYFANTLHDAADEILQWCGRELERGFRAREFDALQTARVLVQ